MITKIRRMQKLGAWASTITLLTVCVLPFIEQVAFADNNDKAGGEIIIDTVVASVDGKPITLQDIRRRIGAKRELTASDLKADPAAHDALESMIFERLILEEASTRKIKVTDADVEAYIDEVAKKNRMSRDEFESALKREQRDIAAYRDQVRVDILRSRIMGQIVQNAAGVSREDVERYLKDNPTFIKSGTKLKLRQIFVSKAGRTPEEVGERITLVQKKLADGEEFAKVAVAISEGPEGPDGGLLGVVNEAELSPQTFDAVFSLREGQSSTPVAMPDGSRIFMLEKRYEEKAELDPALLDEVRKQLQDKKLQERMQTFFTQDLQKQHSVDRKI